MNEIKIDKDFIRRVALEEGFKPERLTEGMLEVILSEIDIAASRIIIEWLEVLEL